LVSTHYMDEAERCNRLAYIVFGRLMAEGTVQEITKKAGLITWAATGKGLAKLSDAIQKEKGVEQVVAWGNELRICGTNSALLEKAISDFPAFDWRKVGTGLEEVFIHFVSERAKEDGAALT